MIIATFAAVALEIAPVPGQTPEARDSLRKALKIISERNPDGPIAPQSTRQLLAGLSPS
jgi:hypothetical protein